MISLYKVVIRNIVTFHNKLKTKTKIENKNKNKNKTKQQQQQQQQKQRHWLTYWALVIQASQSHNTHCYRCSFLHVVNRFIKAEKGWNCLQNVFTSICLCLKGKNSPGHLATLIYWLQNALCLSLVFRSARHTKWLTERPVKRSSESTRLHVRRPSIPAVVVVQGWV